MRTPTFSLAQASAQLPRLRSRLVVILELRNRLGQLYAALDDQGVPPGETLPWGAPADAVRGHAVFAGMSEALREEVDAIHATGAELRDIEVGLVDWPAAVPADAPPILWSWRLGEPAIEHFRERAEPAARRSIAELPAAVMAAAAGRAPTPPLEAAPAAEAEADPA